MKHILRIALPFVALLIFNGCQKASVDVSPAVDGELAEYRLNLSVGEMEAGTGVELRGTRATSDNVSSEIKNLWVIQVNTMDNTIISTPTYISNYQGATNVKLVPCGSGDSYKIVYIANTFKNNLAIYKGDNIDKLADLGLAVAADSDCYIASAGVNYHFLMGEQPMTSGKVLAPCELKYSVAKVTMRLKVKDDIDLSLSSAQMCNVASRLHYYDKGVASNYPAYADLEMVDYAADDLAVGAAEGGYTIYDLTYYVPVNKRGVVSGGVTAETKPLYASAKSTYLKIRGAELSGEETNGVEYKIYLGANLTDDYNLLPNNHYIYDITFETIGDPETDMRVNVMDAVDFTKYPSSNCYIVHSDVDHARKYIIPIGERINKYWVEYELIKQFAVNNNTVLDYDMLWYDMEGGIAGVTVEKYDNPDGVAAVEVTIPAGCDDGNFVFGVKRAGGDYLWSWHIWITDYNPNDYMHYGAEVTDQDKYRYDVTGGEVHHYEADVAYYNTRYVMDRFVGARSVFVTTSPSGMKGALCYQYGRKDPFPAYGAKKANGDNYSVPSLASVEGDINMSISNPMVFYKKYSTAGNWATDGAELWGYPWYDKMAEGYDKSIFDPSPLGWKLISSRYMFSSKSNTIDLIENVKVGVSTSQPIHYTITPKDYVSDTGVDYLAVYPRTPHLGSNSGGSSAEIRSLMRFSNQDAMRFNAPAYVGESEVSLTFGTGYLAYGFAARCESYPEDLVPLTE